jgi:hypothetical protein
MWEGKGLDTRPSTFMSVTAVPYQTKWSHRERLGRRPTTQVLTFPTALWRVCGLPHPSQRIFLAAFYTGFPI